MIKSISYFIALMIIGCLDTAQVFAEPKRPNVLFIISDDLTATALSCYGNTVCCTP